MSETPKTTGEHVKPDPLSDPDAAANTRAGALGPGSTATGDPESHDAEIRVETEASEAHPNALIEGNRVATAEDME